MSVLLTQLVKDKKIDRPKRGVYRHKRVEAPSDPDLDIDVGFDYEETIVGAGSNYKHFIAKTSLMTIEQEMALSKEIENKEIALWRKLLSGQPFIASCVRESVEKLCDEKLPNTAEEIRAVARDRIYAKTALETLGRLAKDKNDRFAKQRHKDCEAKYAEILKLKDRFVSSNLRFAFGMARKFRTTYEQPEDLIQEAMIGLMQGADRYDYRNNVRFCTYAAWWIMQAVTRASQNKGRAVRIPVHLLDRARTVRVAQRMLYTKLGRQPTFEEIADHLGLSESQVKNAITAIQKEVSLDEQVGDDENLTRLDFLEDPSAATASDIGVDASRVKEILDRILSDLPTRHQEVIRRRIGLNQEERAETLTSIGKSRGLSRERIRQIEQIALMKLRMAIEKDPKLLSTLADAADVPPILNLAASELITRQARARVNKCSGCGADTHTVRQCLEFNGNDR